MAKHPDVPQSNDALDELVSQLLGCGAVLSQIISHMVRFQAAGRSAPDAAPIPEVAHSLIRDVLGEIGRAHSRRDLRNAAAIVSEATEAIAEEVFMYPLDTEGGSRANGHAGDPFE
jgi:hypothetical protein